MISPTYAEAYNALGLVYADQNAIDNAIKYYQKAIEVDPEFGFAYNNLAVAYGVKNQPIEDRIKLYLKALEIDSSNHIAYRNLGLLYESQERYDEAIIEYQRAIQANQDDADSYYYLASLYFDLAKWNDSWSACLGALSRNPNHAAAHNLLGILNSKLGNNAAAIEEYMKALEINPDSAGVLSNLGLAHEYRRDFESARFEYEKAKDLEPNDPIVHCRLGALYRIQGKISEGEVLIEQCEKLVSLQPENAGAHNALGIIYFDQKQFDKAISEYLSAIATDPNDPTIYTNLAYAYKSNGQPQEAVDAGEHALRLSPKPHIAHLDLAELRWAAHDYSGVVKELISAWNASSDWIKLSFIGFLMIGLLFVAYTYRVVKECRRHRRILTAVKFLWHKDDLPLLLGIRWFLIRVNKLLANTRRFVIEPLIPKMLAAVNRQIAARYYKLGSITLSEDKLIDVGMSLMHKALSIDPSYSPPVRELATFYLNTRHSPSNAIHILRRHVKAAPDNITMQLLLGDVYIDFDAVEEAIRTWEDCIRADIDATVRVRRGQIQYDASYAVAHFTLGLAYARSREVDEAIVCFEATIANTTNHILRDLAQHRIHDLKAKLQNNRR